MRRRKADLSARVNGELAVEFSESGLTSYAGLELLIRYFRGLGLNQLIRKHFRRSGSWGDFGIVSMIRVLLALIISGGRRLRHVGFLEGDPLVRRFCGLDQLPTSRTLSRFLKRFRAKTVENLAALNAEIVAEMMERLPIKQLIVDVDGSVVSTGMKVERAFRGFNPHRRKVPSYYPIIAYLSESGHILRVKNRSGNVHDGKASIDFFRDLFAQVRETIGPPSRLTFRMDAAFFLEEVLALLERKGAGYSIKVPFWECLGLKRLIMEQRRWKRVSADVEAFEKRIAIVPWVRLDRVVIYRKKVAHVTRKNFQLDLFDPNDGHFEYSAVTTNLPLDPRKLWHFMCGRGMQEKVVGGLKSHLAFDSIPTNHYGANSAWQQIVAIAHNLLVNFQLDTIAPRRTRSPKRTGLFLLQSAQTLRFKVLNRAGLIVRPEGKTILRLPLNDLHEELFLKMARMIQKAA